MFIVENLSHIEYISRKHKAMFTEPLDFVKAYTLYQFIYITSRQLNTESHPSSAFTAILMGQWLLYDFPTF